MGNEIYNLLETFDIDLDLTSEEEVLRKIKEKNKENEMKQVEYNTILSENKREIERQLEGLPSLREIIDTDRLDDKEYVKEVLIILSKQTKEEKDEFIRLSDKALTELGGY